LLPDTSEDSLACVGSPAVLESISTLVNKLTINGEVFFMLRTSKVHRFGGQTTAKAQSLPPPPNFIALAVQAVQKSVRVSNFAHGQRSRLRATSAQNRASGSGLDQKPTLKMSD